MIRGVIFDCFGVLYGQSLGVLKSMCPPARLNELIDANKQVDYGYIDQEQYIATIAEIMTMEQRAVRELLRQEHAPNEELISFVRELSGSYKTGLLSNVGKGGLDGLFSAQELAALFDVVIMSYEEGIIKPAPEIFCLTADRMGLAPHECIMVDDFMANCDGAATAGLVPILHTANHLTIRYVREALARA